jgi:hydroxyacylglutathione hydrolase
MTVSAPGNLTEVFSLTVGPFQENTIFLKSTTSSEVVVIDPGDEAPRLIEFLESRDLVPVAIVNTHAHLNHVGAIQPLKDHFDIPLYLHPDDLPILHSAPAAAKLYALPPPVVPKVEFSLAEGESLSMAGLNLDVIFTPGHTPGHVSFLVDGRLICGDVLFSGSIGRTDLPGGNTETLMNTLFEKILTLPDETIVHCGHGPDTTIGTERVSNPFLVARS